MLIGNLRLVVFIVYLAAWFVLVIAAIAGAIPRFRRGAAVTAGRVSLPVIAGSLLQVASLAVITLTMGDDAIRPRMFELVGTLVLSPLAAIMFAWALYSAPREAGVEKLVTGGAYAWLRHPIYLALLAMLLATGLLISSGWKLVGAGILYLLGTELRVVAEEAELVRKFPTEYKRYRLRTRWRYLPGLR